MHVVLDLPPEQETRLEQKAQRRGTDIPTYIRSLIQRDLEAAALLEEVLEPFRRGFEKSGLSEPELSDLIDSELKAHRAEKRAAELRG